MSATKHLLRWKGRQSGPFAPDEIRTLLKNSEIGLMHEVQMNGGWITVEKFLAQSAPRPPAAPAPKLEKKAPPAVPKLEAPQPPPLANPEPLTALLPRLPVEPAPLTNLEPATDDEPAEPAGEIFAHGGFWLRAVAAGIDGLILSAISWALAAMLLVASGASRSTLPPWLTLFVLALHVVGSWLYFALMESSESQATLGKLAVGLIVSDLDGGRLTFTHATGRYFGKVLSALTLGTGFFMAAFTPRKQALHDLMTGCYVLLRLPPARLFQA